MSKCDAAKVGTKLIDPLRSSPLVALTSCMVCGAQMDDAALQYVLPQIGNYE